MADPKYSGSAYWNPLPDIDSSAGTEIPGGPPDWAGRLPEPSDYLCGKWEERNWRNVPGPIYGAMTDTCWVGRIYAPDHVSYEADSGQEFLYRQPRNRHDVLQVLFGAWNDPLQGWACDGNQHWTPELVRHWWRDRSRVLEWIAHDLKDWAESPNEQERDAAAGLVAYADYIGGALETHLREYLFWLTEGRMRLSEQGLPPL